MFNEWWDINARGLGDQYPWGDINDNPWYYANEDVYSQHMLTTGSVMILPLALSLYFQYKRENKNGFYALLVCIICPYAADFVGGLIQ